MNNKITGVVITRRMIAVAVFTDLQLSYVESRSLSSEERKAARTVLEFIGWLIQQFQFQTVALALQANSDGTRVGQLVDLVTSKLQSEGISIWPVTKKALLGAFAYPALKNQSQLKEVASSIWPHIVDEEHRELELMAAATGLYVQTERYFNH